MRDLPRRLLSHIGRRGAILFFLAVLDCLYGWSLITAPVIARVNMPWFNQTTWGYIWLIGGLIVITGIFVARDRIQYGVSALVTLGFGSALLIQWASQNTYRGWVSVAIFYALGGIILVVSSWPEAVSLSDLIRAMRVRDQREHDDKEPGNDKL